MESEKFELVFHVRDMTSLRYAIPFIKFARTRMNLHVVLSYETSNIKYNSIPKNCSKLAGIIHNNQLHAIDITNHAISARVLLCVECQVNNNIRYDKCYSFQHGFDLLYHAHNSGIKTTYLVNDDHFKNVLLSKNVEAIVQPLPVILWDNDACFHAFSHIRLLGSKVCTLFFPERSYVKEFKQVYNALIENGYTCVIKQRRKHQSVPSDFQHVYYDDVWYPTESIALPLNSDLVVGFETSSYLDLARCGIPYVNFMLSALDNSYVPSLEHLYTLTAKEFDLKLGEFRKIMTKIDHQNNRVIDVEPYVASITKMIREII